MKNVLMKSFLFIFLISQIKSLQLENVCMMSETTCIGSYDKSLKYALKCEKNTCDGKLSFKCDSDHCTSNKITCDSLLGLNFLIKFYSRLKLYDKHLKTYKTFFKSIKSCDLKKYEWTPRDVCLNGLNCHLKEALKIRHLNIYTLKKTECPCSGVHSYRCGDQHCAFHQKGCDEFLLKLKDNSSILNCKNSNIILQF